MEKVLAIVGPTAVGKTALSIELAKSIMVKLFLEIRCKFTGDSTLALQSDRSGKAGNCPSSYRYSEY